MKTEEFEQQLAELRPALYRFTKKFTSNREDSWDLVQDTLAKAWGRRSSFRENKNLAGWLFIIMRNTFINQYRKGLHVSNMVSEDSALRLIDYHRNTKSDDVTHVNEIWKTIGSMNPEFGKPLKMRISGYKYEEIANELKIPIGTVKSRIFMARQAMRNLLPGYC
jgi:RNA polymerase sigma-70 factor (ECF subfamily)